MQTLQRDTQTHHLSFPLQVKPQEIEETCDPYTSCLSKHQHTQTLLSRPFACTQLSSISGPVCTSTSVNIPNILVLCLMAAGGIKGGSSSEVREDWDMDKNK